MEAKLDKIFNIFYEKNNESLFELCVRQIVEIYKDSPSSIYYLLKKAMRLLFSTTKDSYLQLKHRQVAAGIIEKTYRSYTQRLQKFLVTDLQNQDDTEEIDILSLFHMEKITSDDPLNDGDNDIDEDNESTQNKSTKQSAMEIEEEQQQPVAVVAPPPTNKRGAKAAAAKQAKKAPAVVAPPAAKTAASDRVVRSIDEIKRRTHVKVSDIDFTYLLQHEDPLYQREKGFYDSQLNVQHESKELEEQILSRMGLSAELNPMNLQGIMNANFSNSFSEKQRQSTMLDQDLVPGIDNYEDQTDTSSAAQQGNKNKGKKKGGKDGKQPPANPPAAQSKKPLNSAEEVLPRKKMKVDEAEEDANNNVSIKESLGLRLFVPFNNIYRQCLKNLLSRSWEIRHYSAMVLKGFLKENVEFLDFSHRMLMKDIDPTLLESDKQHDLFAMILNTLQVSLREYLGIERNLQDKVDNYLSRSLVIVVMDQLTDYSGKKSDIMIRRVACEMITLILNNNDLVTHEFRLEILNQVNIFLNRSISQPGQRLITQTSLVLINSLLTERQDLREQLFELFRGSYSAILNEEQDEDIVMHLCDNFLIYVGEKKWIHREGTFLSLIISKLWRYVDMFDGISYNIKTILSLLQEFQSLGFMSSSDFTAPHICKLFKYFFHWEEDVRYETYCFLADGMRQLKSDIKKNKRTIELLLDLVARGVVVEKSTNNFQALVKLWILAQPHLPNESMKQSLSLLFEVATSNLSCEKIIQKFCDSLDSTGLPDSSFHLTPHYAFFTNSLSTFAHFDNTTMRLQRIVLLLTQIAPQNKDTILATCINFKNNKNAPNYHQTMLFVLTLLSNFVSASIFPPTIIAEFFNPQELIELMDIKPVDIKTEATQTIDVTITNYLQAIDSITDAALTIKTNSLVQNILMHISLPDLRERRSKYEELRKKSEDLGSMLNNQTEIGLKLMQSMECIVKAIDLFSEKSDDYIMIIKICTIYLFTQSLIHAGKPISNMNLVCRPLPLYIPAEKFAMVSDLVSTILMSLIASVEKFDTVQKLLKNILSKLPYRKKFTKYAITEVEKYQKEIVKYAPKCAAFNSLITQYVDQANTIGKLEFLYTHLITQMQTFQHIQSDHKWLRQNPQLATENTNWEDLEIELRNTYKLLDSLMDLHQIAFVKKVIPFLFSIVSYLHSQRTTQYDPIYSELPEIRRNKIVKVSRKIIRNIIIRSLKGNFRNASTRWIEHANWIQNTVLRSLLSLLKVQNTIAFELLTSILDDNAKDIIDFSGIYVLEVVKCLTSPNPMIKDLAFSNLGKIITSVFLQSNNKAATQYLDVDLQTRMACGNQFIMDFQNNSHFDYKLVVQPRVSLREYQMEGVRWLGFLSKYNLNGALCDDMGLGKTLQVLVVLQNEIKKDLDENKPLNVSLIIAPSSIVDHWYYEIERYLDPSIMKAVVVSSKSFTEDYQRNKDKHRILIASYNTVQRNQAFFASIQYKFCVLDEGHLIKNQKTKVAEAVRSLQAKHKFLLSGTPIQNNLQELWSIFDFLMPGYLGSSRHFREKFSKLFHTNILSFSDEQILFSEEQNRVLQDLHKKVMPFILRRDKKLVLKELPPKIIQDYNCYMTDQQLQLYNDLEKNSIGKCEHDLEEQANSVLQSQQQEENTTQQSRLHESVLRMLSQMISIVNHPCQSKKVKQSALAMNQHNSFTSSGKFVALKQLLTDLGFEEKESIQAEEQQFLTTNKNKVLIFSRFKETLQLICDLLLDVEFSHIKYLKLDGKVQVSKRYAIINKFNEDSECKIMLLTTSVGGLGLNLTSANVVIMFDHNFNPMNDLQAIDRAHRIGQKNTLNVYRMVMKDTLEERIMGIQRFKINIANAIINLDNSSIKNLKDSNLITLFDNMVTENGYNQRKETQDELDLAQSKCNPFKKIIQEFDLWVTDDINKEY